MEPAHRLYLGPALSLRFESPAAREPRFVAAGPRVPRSAADWPGTATVGVRLRNRKVWLRKSGATGGRQQASAKRRFAMNKVLVTALAVVTMPLAACNSYGANDDTLASAGTGAAVGAAAGAGAGALIGGLGVLEGAAIGAAVGGLAGAVWADRNSDGRADGYVYNGQYYEGAPAGYQAASTRNCPSVGGTALRTGAAGAPPRAVGRRACPPARRAAQPCLRVRRTGRATARHGPRPLRLPTPGRRAATPRPALRRARGPRPGPSPGRRRST